MLNFTPRLLSLVSMLSSRPLDDVFVSRVSQTRDNIRGLKGSMLSSRPLDDVFVSRVSQTRENNRGVKVSMLSYNTFIVSRLTHTGHEYMI
jgi:hypothetical protein